MQAIDFNPFQRWYENHTYIRAVDVELPLGRHYTRYEWVGDSNTAIIDPYARITNRFPHIPGETFWLDDMNLIVVDFDLAAYVVTVARFDGVGYQQYLIRKIQKQLQGIKCRIVLTLWVWGLAHVPPQETPSLKHIHWGRK